MNIKKIIFSILILTGTTSFAQDSLKSIPSRKNQTKKQVLDSIKASFVHDKIASCIDSLWMKEMASLDLYDELTLDIKNIDVDQKVDYELPTELLKERLKKMDEKSPFNIEYNVGLENVIKSFLKNRKRAFERLMGISQFYFPLFEESLATQNIPLEIKYLSVVESALNPRAVSRVGATGLWQFMYQTGKQYNLNINSYIDERSDPLKASNAAASYMKNMYAIFGDWDLVLASYNSGPGNVAKAIRRSGGKQNYWNIRKYLPKETQGYLPAFLATMYIFEYHKEHGIKPDKAIANHFATDTVMIKKPLTFKQISDLLDIPVAEIQFLNPLYKREVIPFVSGEQHYLRLPVDKIAVFTSNESKIYAYATYEESKRERPYESLLASNDSIGGFRKLISKIKFHKVKKGENLKKISNEYGIAENDLKKWNHIRGNKVSTGRKLKIVVTESIAVAQKKSNKKDTIAPKASTALATTEGKVFKEEKVVSFKNVIKTYKVKKGDNLAQISDKFDVEVSEIKKWNHLKGNRLSVGKSIQIHKNERVVSIVKKEIKTNKEANENVNSSIASNSQQNPKDFYEVQKGDNLFSIAKKFNVSLDNLKKWNHLDDLNVKLGSKLAIMNDEEDNTSTDEPKTEVKTIEYKVQKGDNLANIAKKNNTTIDLLKEWNKLEDNNIKLGEKLIVSKKEIAVNETKNNKKDNLASNETEKVYYVKKGDSLYSISKKYPGVSISDLKKLNGIKNEDLKPGMKLKING